MIFEYKIDTKSFVYYQVIKCTCKTNVDKYEELSSDTSTVLSLGIGFTECLQTNSLTLQEPLQRTV